MKVKNAASGTLADAHKAKVQKATKVAMNKLMQQIGKPYRWGGSSPRTGFDCSGLVYYAYKDLVKIRIPRTANEMYHLRDAAPIERSELKNGDLVFFRTQGRGTADHVGVYVGNGKFIQSPRTGQEIQITSLSEDYWQRHYVGARRVMTPKHFAKTLPCCYGNRVSSSLSHLLICYLSIRTIRLLYVCKLIIKESSNVIRITCTTIC